MPTFSFLLLRSHNTEKSDMHPKAHAAFFNKYNNFIDF